MARKDAAKGIYMDENYCAYINQFEENYVSPDRAGLAAALTPVVQNAKYTDEEASYHSLIDMVTEKIREWSASPGFSI